MLNLILDDTDPASSNIHYTTTLLPQVLGFGYILVYEVMQGFCAGFLSSTAALYLLFRVTALRRDVLSQVQQKAALRAPP